jgi:hypothetical protein
MPQPTLPRVIRPPVSVLMLVLALVVVPLALVATPAEAQARDGFGVRVHGDSRSLVSGCRKVYTFDYRVRVPRPDDWSLEISILNPRGEAIHASAFIGKADGTSDRRRRTNVRYKFCRRVTTPGRHVVKAKLVYSVPASTPLGEAEDRVKRDRDRFRLTR